MRGPLTLSVRLPGRWKSWPEVGHTPSQVELFQRCAEVLVVEDLLEDLLVGVDTGHDGLKELLVADQAKVVEAIALRLVGQIPATDRRGPCQTLR